MLDFRWPTPYWDWLPDDERFIQRPGGANLHVGISDYSWSDYWSNAKGPYAISFPRPVSVSPEGAYIAFMDVQPSGVCFEKGENVLLRIWRFVCEPVTCTPAALTIRNGTNKINDTLPATAWNASESKYLSTDSFTPGPVSIQANVSSMTTELTNPKTGATSIAASYQDLSTSITFDVFTHSISVIDDAGQVVRPIDGNFYELTEGRSYSFVSAVSGSTFTRQWFWDELPYRIDGYQAPYAAEEGAVPDNSELSYNGTYAKKPTFI